MEVRHGQSLRVEVAGSGHGISECMQSYAEGQVVHWKGTVTVL